MIKKITQNEFSETINNGGVVTVVKFEADWCIPCKEITPSVELLQNEWDGKGVEFVSLDIEDAPQVTQQYSIYGVPTFIAFKDGQPVSEVRSRVNYSNLKSAFEKYLV
jgi:thioredoxin 1